MNLSMKQKQTHRYKEQTCGCQSGWSKGADGVGVWDYQIQTIIYMYKTGALCYTPETNTPL